MLPRAVAILIVLFWFTMTALLLRNEVRPGDSALREVPVGHVVKLLFHHQQASDLNIVSNKQRLGQLRLAPHNDKAAGRRIFNFSGNLHFAIPGVKGRRQRIAWKGELELNKELETQRFRIGMTMHEPQDYTTEITVLPAEKLARYVLRMPGGVVERQEYSLDEKGAQTVLAQLGFDPTLTPSLPQMTASAPVVRAQQSSLTIHGEPIDTYLVTVESNGQTWLECHVSQLGQVLRATTLLGYTFVPDDLTP